MRTPNVRRNRDCIHPEISRTFTFGAQGASQGQFYQLHLAKIRLNDQPIDWQLMDLSFLMRPAWDAHFDNMLRESDQHVLDALSSGLQTQLSKLHDTRACVFYDNVNEYSRIATQLGVMNDAKDGVHRSSYNGVVWIRWESNELFIRPRHKPQQQEPKEAKDADDDAKQ